MQKAEIQSWQTSTLTLRTIFWTRTPEGNIFHFSIFDPRQYRDKYRHYALFCWIILSSKFISRRNNLLIRWRTTLQKPEHIWKIQLWFRRGQNVVRTLERSVWFFVELMFLEHTLFCGSRPQRLHRCHFGLSALAGRSWSRGKPRNLLRGWWTRLNLLIKILLQVVFAWTVWFSTITFLHHALVSSLLPDAWVEYLCMDWFPMSFLQDIFMTV